ncbi:DUF6809 family protein [Paenibacillus sp. BAC0078]
MCRFSFQGVANPTVISTDPEYRPLNRKISEAVENWKNRLSEQGFEDLEELLYLCGQADSMQTRAAFLHGFKLGSAIIMKL